MTSKNDRTTGRKIANWLQQRLSIRIAFTLPFFLLTISMSLVIGYILYTASFQVTNQVLYIMNEKVLEQVDLKLTHELYKPIQLNQVNFNALQSGVFDIDQRTSREPYFVSVLKGYENVAMTYVGREDGSFYGARRATDQSIQVVINNKSTNGASVYYTTDGKGHGLKVVDTFKNFDPRTRPWYTKAKTEQVPVFSDIYQHFVFKEPTITAARPVYENGKLVGVLGVDYLLTWLEGTLKDFPVGNHGLVYIVDQKNNLIGSSLGIPIFKMKDKKNESVKVQEADNPLIKASMALAETMGHQAQFELTNEGIDYMVSRNHFDDYGLDWTVYVITAKRDFIAPIVTAVTRTLFILGISIIIFFYVAYFMARTVLRPILDLSEAADELSHGKSRWVDDRDRQDEIGQLIKNFNRMSKDLTNLVTDLEAQVNLRTHELQEKNAMLEKLSFKDGLTQVANRRKFDEALAFSWEAASRSGNDLVLLMLDIDRFKYYNDTYGHLEGDNCLKKIGELLQASVKRGTDLVARYGGEEFAIILNNTDIHYAEDLASKILKDVRALNIEHRSSEYQRVTLSIGVAVLSPTDKSEPSQLIDLADQALYQAKSSGRNTYCMIG